VRCALARVLMRHVMLFETLTLTKAVRHIETLTLYLYLYTRYNCSWNQVFS
jgi:hypothetical protein